MDETCPGCAACGVDVSPGHASLAVEVRHGRAYYAAYAWVDQALRAGDGTGGFAAGWNANTGILERVLKQCYPSGDW